MTNQISVVIAFTAGVLSILSPCVLALIPAYLGFLAGVNKRQLWLASLLFILGFSSMFIIFGASATAIGQLFLANQNLLNKVAGITVVVLGLNMLGIIKLDFISFPRSQRRAPQTKYSWANGLLLGLAFAAGWSPCVGPILGSILVIASIQDSVTHGIILLAFYSLGMAIPFLLISALYKTVSLAPLKKIAAYLPFISGVILILVGISLYFNLFSYLARFALLVY